jgi:WD40 repeat protein
MLASTSADKTVKLWKSDGTSFKLFQTLEGHEGPVYRVSFSPDGEILASASNDNTVKLWRRDGTLLTTLTGHRAGVFYVNFSPDGTRLASSSNDKTVILWNLLDYSDDRLLDELLERGCDWLHDYRNSNSYSDQLGNLCEG